LKVRLTNLGTRAQFNALTELLVFLYISAPLDRKAEAREKVERYRQWLWVHSK